LPAGLLRQQTTALSMLGKPAHHPPATRLPELDGLRALAILLVLFSHHFSAAPVAAVRQAAEMGWIGVDIFFVLSGFLIGGILLDQRAAANYYRVFYLRRFFRIVPLYAVLVLPGLLVLGLGLQRFFAGHSLAGLPAAGLWSYPFFLQNVAAALGLALPAYLGPAWSVAVEEQFYLLLPPLVRRLERRQLLFFLLLAIGVAPVVRGLLVWHWGVRAGIPCYVLLPCRWDSLLLGVVAAMAYRAEGFQRWMERHRTALHGGWWGGALLTGTFLILHPSRLDPYMAFLGYSGLDSFFALTLLLAVTSSGGWLQRVFRWPVFKPIATISYGLYLLQSPMMAVTETLCRAVHLHYAPISWLATAVALTSLLGTFVAAGISWQWFESRMLRRGQRFTFQVPSA